MRELLTSKRRTNFHYYLLAMIIVIVTGLVVFVASANMWSGSIRSVATASALPGRAANSAPANGATNTAKNVAWVVLLQDGFETNFNKWTKNGATDWDRTTSQKYSGRYSAHAGANDNDLISNDMNTAGRTKIRIQFRYRDDDIDDDDDVYLQLYNGSTYINRAELGTYSPEDTWHMCDVTLVNWDIVSTTTTSGATTSTTTAPGGTDAQFFRSNFRIKFEGTSIDAGENLWIDDVNVTVQ
jgi:hypothetical protein